MPEPLPRTFYARPVLQVAPDLIGKQLVHVTAEGICRGRIVEAEAYRGPEDLAAHSAGGRRTKRTEVMWGPPGHAYMFLLYGMHWAFNVVVAGEGEPQAVLIRALEPLTPLAPLAARRNMAEERKELTNGPGKLCAALGLDGSHYGEDLCVCERLYLTDGDRGRVGEGRGLSSTPRGRIGRSPRIHIDYAGAWVDKPWRFYERGNRYVSVKPRA